MAQVIIPGIAAAVSAGTATAGQLLIFGAVNLGVSAVASYALNALTPKPKIPGSGGFLVNEVNPTAPAEYGYGEGRKGGPVTHDEATDDNAILHRFIVLGAGEYEVVEVYLNDEIVDLSDNSYSLTDPSDPSDVYEGAGWVITEKWMEDNRIREPRIRIFWHEGNQTAATDTFANSSTATLANTYIAASGLAGMDNNFVGRDLTYLYVQLNIDAEVFAGGIPRITAKIRRKGIYDPRDDTNKITSNGALCIADYVQANYGLDDPGSVDNTDLQVWANICDEDVALDGGGTQKRYEVNGFWRADEQPGQVLSRLLPSISGTMFWGQGNWYIRPGEYAGSIASFDLSDLRSAIQVETRTPRAQNYNAVRGVFNDKSQRYIEGEYPRISSATFLSVDGGFENVLDYDLPFETDGTRAQRLAKLALYRQREQIRVEADFNMRAASVQPGDVIDLTIARYGWTNKEFEVVGWTLKISETGTLCVRLSLKETSEAAFDWDAEESVFDSNNTNLPDNLTVPTVVIGAPIVNYIQNPGGTEQPRVTVPWSVTSPGLVYDYVFEWRENTIDYDANGGFVELGGTPSAREQEVYAAYLKGLGRVPDQNGFDFYVSGGGAGLSAEAVLIQITNSTEGQAAQNFQSMVLRTTRAELRSLSFDRRYDFRVYARNARGARSAYDATTYLVTPDTEAPGTPTGLNADGDFGTILLSWVNPTDLDLMHIEIWEGSTSVLANASLLAVTQGSTYVRANLAPQTRRYYWVRASDYTGNLSGFAGPVNAITRRIETTDIGPAVIDYDNFAADVVALFDGIAADIGQLTTDTVALEADVTTLQTQYTSLNGSVSTNSTAISGLETRVTSAEGAITTSASQITALQSDLSSVESDVSGQATAISGLDARVTDNEGDISAVSSSLTSLSTTVGSNTTSISQAITSIDGIEAKYSVDVDANGIASGFQLIGGGGGSAFNIRADQFNIFPPTGGTGGDQVFSVFSTARTINGITYPAGTYINQAYVGAAEIVGLTADDLTVTNLADIAALFSRSSGSRSLLINPTGSFEVLDVAGSGSQNVARIVKTSSTSTGTALEIRQEGATASGMFIDKVGGGSGDALLIETDGGSGSAGADIRNVATGGGEAQIALSSANGGYAFNAVDGGYFDGSGGGYNPFTGVHLAMLAKTATPEVGDILCDHRMIVTTISDAFGEVVLSHRTRQPNALGVLQKRSTWIVPPAFIDREATEAAGETVLISDPSEFHTDFDLVSVNSVGEGAINVCGQGGNIRAGDLIMTSDIPGKGMKQGSNIVKSYSVARARESVTFDHPDQVKLIACIYLCG